MEGTHKKSWHDCAEAINVLRENISLLIDNEQFDEARETLGLYDAAIREIVALHPLDQTPADDYVIFLQDLFAANDNLLVTLNRKKSACQADIIHLSKSSKAANEYQNHA